jgi:hypothetical protein
MTDIFDFVQQSRKFIGSLGKTGEAPPRLLRDDETLGRRAANG